MRDILKGQKALENVKVTLDISHWVCCLERCFASKESVHENGKEPWFNEVMELVKKHTYLTHARVGYGEGPQVPDPTDPVYKADVNAHMDWWESVMKS